MSFADRTLLAWCFVPVVEAWADAALLFSGHHLGTAERGIVGGFVMLTCGCLALWLPAAGYRDMLRVQRMKALRALEGS